jgi:hypothetical protein
VNALNTAKEEGNNFISSDSLPVSTPEQPTAPADEGGEKVLNLDQMVAKFTGDELPIAQDPFEPMKKALEEEEKKELLEKGVDINDNIPLVIEPEKTDTPINEENNTAPSPLSQTSELNTEIPALEPQTTTEIPSEISQQPPAEQTTLSLDDIVDTAAPATPPITAAPTASTSPSFFGNSKNLRLLAIVGGGVVLVFVLIIMFPTFLSPSITPSSTPPDQTVSLPIDPEPSTTVTEPVQTPPEEPVHNVSDTPSLPTEPVQTLPDPTEEDTGSGQPFLPDEPTEPTITEPTQISPQEMITELTNLSNQSKQYLDIGEMDDDQIIVKYAGYVRYQAGLMINQLES